MTNGKPAILVVEDEAALVTLLRYNLEKSGYAVDEATDGEEALIRVAKSKPDLVLLDWMLPSLSGIEVCRQIRRRPETRALPIIMLTARAEDQDMVRGLNTGADDYITKPFSTEALLARIRSLLRRASPSAEQAPLSFRGHSYGSRQPSCHAKRPPCPSRPHRISPARILPLTPERVFSREQLLNSVWGQDIHVEPRTVDVHIRRLRKALNDGDLPDIVRTVRSAGYALDTEQV